MAFANMMPFVLMPEDRARNGASHEVGAVDHRYLPIMELERA